MSGRRPRRQRTEATEMAKIGTLTRAQAAKTLLGLVPKISVENLVRASRFAEKLTRVERDRAVIRALRELFEREHPAILMAKDVMERLSPNVRRKIIENLFVNAFLIGTDKREIEMPKKEGFKPPMLLVISPTMRCNLRCPGCYAGEYEQHKGLSTEAVDRIIREAKEMGTYFITMSGGEIFMRPDMFDIWKEHDDVFFQLYTNGSLIDKKVAARLEDCGNVAPMISLEGFRERTDERRGPGAFDTVLEAMDNLREAGVLFGTSFTETRENMEEIASDEILDLLVEKGALGGVVSSSSPQAVTPKRCAGTTRCQGPGNVTRRPSREPARGSRETGLALAAAGVSRRRRC